MGAVERISMRKWWECHRETEGGLCSWIVGRPWCSCWSRFLGEAEVLHCRGFKTEGKWGNGHELHVDLSSWKPALNPSKQTAIYSVIGFPCSSNGKESACNAGDQGLIPGSGRSSGEGNGNPLQYSWRIPWIEKPGRLQSVGSQRVKHDWATNTHTHILCHIPSSKLRWSCWSVG